MERFQRIIDDLGYKAGGFRLTQNGECVFLQHWQWLSDTSDLKSLLDEQRGRKWYLSGHMTDGEVIQTALSAVLAFEEHEARESFLYKGDRIFSSHKSVASLRVIGEEKRA